MAWKKTAVSIVTFHRSRQVMHGVVYMPQRQPWIISATYAGNTFPEKNSLCSELECI